ncbi:hypothetical protein SporoP37_08000 [Sporosarcina sp. P37]|uniref:hypothetical protein n=1 Tax=unclassified Sporosarcina TaxID=2647733 RepID=UPI000A17BA2F|nr:MULTISPECIES: hypothetical protein [unclassified Sporosarcina]ARK24606.1 hypothetical protein SporoP37_08000 [Sporosarcina sp. P37]PID19764.1 hypothetical protein CSV62_00535 [Sporosarcina sp. P35]
MNEKLVMEYIIACTNLYGVVPIDQVAGIFNEQNEDMITPDELNSLLQSGQVRGKLEEYFVYADLDKFIAEAASEGDEKEELEQAAAGKPYYVPAKEELLRFIDEEYIQETQEQLKLKSMLIEDFGDELHAEEEVRELVFNLQVSGGDFMGEMSMFIAGLELPVEKAERYIPVIVDVANTTRLWENRGHTTKELLP